MGNVTLPTPVFVAGGAFCLLAGYLAGAVVGPDSHRGTTATVVSFDSGSGKLCLKGDSVKDDSAADDKGVLCGAWSHSTGSTLPRAGDSFRFVVQETAGVQGSRASDAVVIYGTVVDK